MVSPFGEEVGVPGGVVGESIMFTWRVYHLAWCGGRPVVRMVGSDPDSVVVHGGFRFRAGMKYGFLRSLSDTRIFRLTGHFLPAEAE
ncbi:hypothetical protein AOE01nite_10630 [Acetobacter oeni]|uniref:Uncharacterized protein n=1 Tax=Acetobacter oeni TaxID=304077 RepID=A0A511XIR8_9PROT|nr:hypothetical protein AA21952_2415 [Acetobacter oeni LMG 21952]GEN62839.1 hypothetical protein AOE01nite_10630 [Acetobacter oeni]